MLNKTLGVILDIPVITKAAAFVLAFFCPIQMVVHTLLVFLVIDAITSIYWQYKCHLRSTKEQLDFKHRMMLLFATVESKKLRRTIEKMFFYIIALMAFFMFDTIFLKVVPNLSNTLNTFSITNLSAILIGLVELTSIASNVSKITNNPVFNKIMKITQNKVKNEQ